jgi:hypothetical protein
MVMFIEGVVVRIELGKKRESPGVDTGCCCAAVGGFSFSRMIIQVR